MTKVEKVRAPDSKPARAKRASEKPKFAYSERLKDYRRTAYAVWEITLKCNLACTHCGSRVGDAREGELSTDEALDLVRQLADAGITEVSLIGGEAFLRPDWLVIARAIADAGMIPTMVTGAMACPAPPPRKWWRRASRRCRFPSTGWRRRTTSCAASRARTSRR
jgi:hypothetical protein